ncbi:MAG: tetratricopeptide repeat protein [Burkholderiaceae bacterium]|jgi:predicted negative regulator of RcsB-dependent stress response|nr:tetratricopeptide repeat protein [Burkholderiaceae bacterium]MEB2319351.1 tetratricopeptide repeat protein [Pseudomonadota bacterium]
MAYDLEEQERLDDFKAFWNKHGNTILTVLTVVLLAVAAWRGWAWYESNRSARAAAVYHQLKVAVDEADAERIRSTAQVLRKDFSATAYARMGSLVAAEAQSVAGANDAAIENLRWVVDKGGDEIFVLVARLRLASLLIESQAWDEAARVLDVETPSAFAGLYADRRGDLAMAQGRKDEARAAYGKALETLGPATPIARLVQLKLDSLGSTGTGS